VIVPESDYARAREALEAHWEVHEGGFSSPTATSFKDDATAPPLGVHLTVAGSEDDFQWRNRDALLARPDLRARLEQLKSRHQGGSMDDYRDEKGMFFWRLRDQAEYPRD